MAFAVLLCVQFLLVLVNGGPAQLNTGIEFQNALNQQSIQTLLTSIEARFKHLDGIYAMQFSPTIAGKIDYYGRKFDNIESKLSRLEAIMTSGLAKISENTSSRNFKDDITKDHIFRKLDTIYERINYRLGFIESKLEMGAIKLQNTVEMVATKLEKMEESLTARDADLEAELVDAIAAIDDLKTTCSNMEENIRNTTAETIKNHKNVEGKMKKYHLTTIQAIDDVHKNISGSIKVLEDSKLQNDFITINRNLNEYANKVADMYSDFWNKGSRIESSLQNVATVLNLTRSEQQNGLRALMVQVGRKLDKKSSPGEFTLDQQKFDELNEKLDTNFENVLMTQNLFLESCHRVQADESQLESKIGIVLERIIDTFENKTSVSPNDIKNLEQTIKIHDLNVRKSAYYISNNVMNILQKNMENKEFLEDHITSAKGQLDELYSLIQNGLLSSNVSNQVVFDNIKNLQNQFEEINSKFEAQTTNGLIREIQETLTNITKKENSQNVALINEYVNNIYRILTSIESKIRVEEDEFKNILWCNNTKLIYPTTTEVSDTTSEINPLTTDGDFTTEDDDEWRNGI